MGVEQVDVLEAIDANARECVQRTKRMETKLSKLMEHMGMAVAAGSLPKWDAGGVVNIPSMDVSFKQILEAIPDDWTSSVLVLHNRTQVARVQMYPGVLTPKS